MLCKNFITHYKNTIYKGLSGGEIVYKILLKEKVTDVFLYTGGAVMGIIDPFYKQKEIKYYINTHEQSSGHSATAYAKSSGKPGVVIVTSGPGLTNLITAITDATNDSTPLIVLSGQVPLANVGTNAFQECPSVDITSPITKWSYMIEDVSEIPEVMENAFKISQNGKPGAVHIDFPKCTTINKFSDPIKIPKKKIRNIPKIVNKHFEHKHTYSQIGDIINQSQKPVILVGKGCNNYSELLREFVLKSNIPVTTTLHAMGVFDETKQQSLQFLGMHGNVSANYAIQNADLIIALGNRFDDRTTGKLDSFAKGTKGHDRKGIIHVNINEKEINFAVNTQFNFKEDCGVFLEKIIPLVLTKGRFNWFSTINQWKNKYPFNYERCENGKLKTQQVINSMNSYLDEKCFITTGVGNHQMMAAQFIQWKHPNSFITSGSLGVMGTGLPYAIGCQIANPNDMVLDIDGDGSFNQTLSELKTVANYDLPIKIAIMNDTTLSMVESWETLFFDKNYTATNLIQNPDYSKLAESYGIKALKCTNEEELPDVLNKFFTYDKAILCDFIVQSDLCLPLVAPGKALNDMIISKDQIRDQEINKKDLPS